MARVRKPKKSAKHQHAPGADADTQARLIAAAKTVFAEKGFAGATVKEISEIAGVNISLISYHFNGKEGLFRASLEKFGRERLHDAKNILTPPDSMEDMRAKLKLWARQFLQCHVQENNECSILHKEDIFKFEFMKDIFMGTFLEAFLAVVAFFAAGKKKGLVRKELDPQLIAALLFGSLIHVGRTQKIQKEVLGKSIDKADYLDQVVDQFVSIMLGGIQ